MTSKQKNIALIVGFFLLLLACYQLAIKNTLEQKKVYTSLKNQEQLFKNVPKQLAVLRQKETHYDSLLTKYQLDGTSIQNNLLKTINGFANSHNIKVVSFLEPHAISNNDLVIKTYDFVLEGNYNSINTLIYQLEQKTKFGEVINLHFEKKKNFKTGKYYLQARVLLKSFG